MAEVIKLTDKYIDTTSIYDRTQKQTQSALNTSFLNSLDYRMYARGQASQSFSTYKELIQTDCRYSRGVYGSVSFSSTTGSDNVSSGWHWFLYVPHRNGGTGGDNSQYGVLFLVPFWGTSYYLHVVKYTSGNSYSVKSY